MADKLSPLEAAAVMSHAGLEPLTPYPGYAKPWKSICKVCKNTVTPSYANVRKRKSGCKFCAGAVVDELAAITTMMNAGLQPLEPYSSNSKPWRSLCLICLNEVSPAFANVKNRGKGCKFCSGHVVRHENVVAIVSKNQFVIEGPYKNLSKMNVRCISCRNVMHRSLNSMRNGHGCKFCKGLAVSEEEATIVMLNANLKTLEPFPGSHVPWNSIHLICGQKVAPHYNNVRNRGSGCNFCGQKSAHEKSRTPEVEASMKMLEVGLKPLEPYQNSKHPWKSLCLKCGKTVSPSLSNIQTGESRGCAYCSGKPPKYKQDEAVVVLRSHGFEPLEPYIDSQSPWKCECLTCGATVFKRFTQVAPGRESKQSGCIYCLGQVITHEVASKIMHESNLEPLEPYVNSKTNWRCRCLKCGNTVSPRYSDIYSGDGGCSTCANYGMTLSAPSVVYLIQSDDFFALKVGISNKDSIDRRLDSHAKFSFIKVINTWDCADGVTAKNIERTIIKWWRDSLFAPIALPKNEMPSGGWSETASLLWVDAEDTANHIDQLVSELDNS